MIPYIKRYKWLLSDCVYSTILFVQALYWYGKMDRPYYKFLKSCPHPLCRAEKEDNWAEDLGFSEYQVKSVLKKIGTKLKRGEAYNLLECGFLLYWNAGHGMTYYCPNYPKLSTIEANLEHFKEDFPHFKKWYNDFPKVEAASFKIVFSPSIHFNFTDFYIQENTQEFNQKNTQKKEQPPFFTNNFSQFRKPNVKEKNSAKKESKAPMVVMPFDTLSFAKLWQGWKEYLSISRSYTYSLEEEQEMLILLSNYNEEYAEHLISKAIQKGWKNFHFSNTPALFEQNNNTHGLKQKSFKASVDPIAEQVLKELSK